MLIDGSYLFLSFQWLEAESIFHYVKLIDIFYLNIRITYISDRWDVFDPVPSQLFH